MISIRIHLLADKGKQNKLVRAVENLNQRIAMDDGCLAFRVFQGKGNETAYFFSERSRK